MTKERRHPNIANADEVDPYQVKQGKHHIVGRVLGRAGGSQQLGGTLTELPRGAISFPFHYHCANEEAIYVVSGTGTARIGDARVSVRAGDWIAYPVGPAHAHQMINDSDAPLVYLCVSTGHNCEVVGYPDSKKLGVRAGESFGGPDKGLAPGEWVRQLVNEGESLDYFDGEPNA